jgi:hypothetical protein
MYPEQTSDTRLEELRTCEIYHLSKTVLKTMRDTKHTTGRVIENVMSVDVSTHKLLNKIRFVYCIIMYYYIKLSYYMDLYSTSIQYTRVC